MYLNEIWPMTRMIIHGNVSKCDGQSAPYAPSSTVVSLHTKYNHALLLPTQTIRNVLTIPRFPSPSLVRYTSDQNPLPSAANKQPCTCNSLTVSSTTQHIRLYSGKWTCHVSKARGHAQHHLIHHDSNYKTFFFLFSCWIARVENLVWLILVKWAFRMCSICMLANWQPASKFEVLLGTCVYDHPVGVRF
jgi:hypothetical protein